MEQLFLLCVEDVMQYTVFYHRIDEPGIAEGMYYAHIPTLDLVTHGKGIEGACEAAQDLIELWITEKKANGELVPVEDEVLTEQITIPDALFGT